MGIAGKVALVTGGGKGIGRTDVSDRDQVFAAAERVANEIGGFDVMVNNAGIAQVQTIEDVRPPVIP